MLLTAAAYAAAGWLALRLPLGGGWASPLYPSAGIALAATLVFGLRGALGSALGAFGVNLLHASAVDAGPALVAWGLPAAVAIGAAIQALLGRAALARAVGLPVTLRTPTQIARFSVWGGIVPCLFNATWSNTALGLAGIVPADALVQSWWTWWLGDVLGLLVAAPIALSLIGHPREDWAPRRLSVGLPMLVGMALLAMATIAFHRWERERLQETFGHGADAAVVAIDEQLDESIYALRAIHGMLAAHDDPRHVPLQPAADWWFEHSKGLLAIGYSERVPRQEVAAFEADAHASGLAGYRVFDRADSTGLAAEDPYVVAIRAITPRERNAAALGVNAMSVAAAREALLAAARGGDDASTQGFTLTQAERAQENGVVVYRALYHGRPATPEERLAQWRGVVFVTLDIGHALTAVMRRIQGPLQWCLIEGGEAGNGAPRRLGGPEGCERSAAAEFSTLRQITFADRGWSLRLRAGAKDLPGGLHTGRWLLSLIGVVATSLLGALLLTITGRARRIELAVQERTRALSAEVRERRAAEVALRDSEQRLRGILDHIPIGVAFMDRRGRLLDTNPSLCRMLGRTEAELRRLRFKDVGGRDRVAADLAAARALVDGRATAVSGQTRLRRADGSLLPVRYALAALHDAEGRVARLVGVVEDISEHLRLAASERARDAAEAANRAKSEFVSRMSHELRTPLNAMLGFAQLLGMDRGPALAPHQEQWVTQIQHAGWHLLDLINDTLDMSRIESGLIQLEARALELEPMVRACLSLLEGAARRRGLRMRLELDPRATAVRADETRLKQVLTNLLSNAVKYNRDGGELVVASQPAGDGMVEVTVRDTGIGMSAKQLSELFQPYNRLGRERTTIEGTGIGLVISRRLAELMGGTLEARSTEHQGSEFRLRLPQAPAGAAGAAATATGLGPGEEAEDASRRVHYVEDNPTNIEVVRGILARRPQIALDASLSGRDGLEAMRRHRPDLILLDMHLPDIDGMDLLRALKRNDELADVPVVVLSADASRARVEQALTLGAVKYLTKPLEAGALIAAVDDVLAELVTRWG